MAHGAPDYSNVQKGDFVYRLNDMAELVARQSNLASLDRRGETIFTENFKYGIGGWGTYLEGTDAAVALSADKFVSGGFSCKLTGGSTTDFQARIHKHLPYLRVAQMGLEARVHIGNYVDYVQLEQQFFDGVNAQYTAFRYDFIDGTLSVRQSLTSWTIIATDIYQVERDQYFSYMKMVSNFATGKYVYVKFNDTEVDVSDYTNYTFSSNADQLMTVQIKLIGMSGQNGFAYIDNVIVTRND